MKLKVRFSETANKISPIFGERTKKLSPNMGELHTVTEYLGEQYTGAYEVTPKLEAQTLPTKDKVLTNNLTVKEIEIHRVKNSSGGITVYIARGV